MNMLVFFFLESSETHFDLVASISRKLKIAKIVFSVGFTTLRNFFDQNLDLVTFDGVRVGGRGGVGGDLHGSR